MSELVHHCPRCGANSITFDVRDSHFTGYYGGWQRRYEAFCICRHCHRSTVFNLSQRELDDERYLKNAAPEDLNAPGDHLYIDGYVSQSDADAKPAPEHVPNNIEKVFMEGSKCIATQCWNAAGTMFRLSVDLATAPLLPSEETEGLNSRTRRDLGLRVPWLIENGRLPKELKGLSDAIREDGNDGAHRGILTKEDAFDILDFTEALLERMFTEPERLKQAQERREARRKK